MTTLKTLSTLAFGCSLLAAVPAFADGAAGGGSVPGDPETAAAPPPTSSTPSAPGPAAAESGDGLIDASPTLAKGKALVYGDLDILTASFGDSSATQEGLHLGGAYGVSDVLSVGAEYTFPIAGDGTDDVKGKGPLRLFAEYKIKQDAKVSLSAQAAFEFNLCGSIDETGGGCASSQAISATFNARYKVAPKIEIFTGNPVGPGVAGGVGGVNLSGFGIGGFFNGAQLNIGFADGAPQGIAIPVGIGIQAAPKVFLFAETVLGTVFISNGPTDDEGNDKSAIFIGSDDQGVLLNAGAYFSANKQLDVGVTFFDNLQHAGDLYVIGIAGRYHL